MTGRQKLSMQNLASPTNLARFSNVAHAGGVDEGLRPSHPALAEKRTIFPSTVIEPGDSPRILVSGKNQRKLGNQVLKGRWRGMMIFALTLEERATCPDTCHQWATCYGNNMHLSRRHRHGSALEEKLDAELFAFQDEYPEGFVVRLHILGDFYDNAYVFMWRRFMEKYPALRLFGYTANPPASHLGRFIDTLNGDYGDRAYVRFSLAAPDPRVICAITIPNVDAERFGAIICPAQTGKTQCCATCGICWATDKTIAFLQHPGRLYGSRRSK